MIIFLFLMLFVAARSRDMNDTVVTLAHELGHSLGSKHDEDVSISVIFFTADCWKINECSGETETLHELVHDTVLYYAKIGKS